MSATTFHEDAAVHSLEANLAYPLPPKGSPLRDAATKTAATVALLLRKNEYALALATLQDKIAEADRDIGAGSGAALLRAVKCVDGHGVVDARLAALGIAARPDSFVAIAAMLTEDDLRVLAHLALQWSFLCGEANTARGLDPSLASVRGMPPPLVLGHAHGLGLAVPALARTLDGINAVLGQPFGNDDGPACSMQCLALWAAVLAAYGSGRAQQALVNAGWFAVVAPVHTFAASDERVAFPATPAVHDLLTCHLGMVPGENGTYAIPGADDAAVVGHDLVGIPLVLAVPAYTEAAKDLLRVRPPPPAATTAAFVDAPSSPGPSVASPQARRRGGRRRRACRQAAKDDVRCAGHRLAGRRPAAGSCECGLADPRVPRDRDGGAGGARTAGRRSPA